MASRRAWLNPRWEASTDAGEPEQREIRRVRRQPAAQWLAPACAPSRRATGVRPSYFRAWMASRMRPVIRPVRNGAHEGRRGKAAGPAHRHARVPRKTVHRRSGSMGHRHGQGIGPASFANWNRRKERQRGAAEGTARREESTTRCVHGTSEDARYSPPRGCPRVVERRAQ